jgi:hypothetical protein
MAARPWRRRPSIDLTPLTMSVSPVRAHGRLIGPCTRSGARPVGFHLSRPAPGSGRPATV